MQPRAAGIDRLRTGEDGHPNHQLGPGLGLQTLRRRWDLGVAREHLVVGDVTDDPRPLRSYKNPVEGLLEAPPAPAEEVQVMVHLLD